ncbi:MULTISPECIES: hypothetical protein [Streptomyces]|uniref:hypothetical protein n=1 Tax=Streptomyces TaxID=1883 RepID=UPI00167732E7|nr:MULTISPECIES: hypothetical protein [Streptomyces]MBK3526177.1 hypothetical protein [Streptomyces sp. MBT70]GGR57674.1 hypothetical protein GCM10010236_07390 [Streptomyces eurythermus]
MSDGVAVFTVFERQASGGRLRLEVATRSGVPATVSVRDADRGRISIHSSYGQPIRFAGHPLPATVEALHSIGRVPRELIPDAGPVPCRRDADGTVWLTLPEAW